MRSGAAALAAPGMLAMLAWAGGAAQAQVSGSAAVASEYLYRGVSFSAGDPAPQLNLNYDGAAGYYLGAFASTFKLYRSAPSRAHLISYAGLARRLPSSGAAWDVGALQMTFPSHAAMNSRELYVGLAADAASGRLYYAPNYLGLSVKTLYADLNASHAPWPGLTLFAHLGYLASLPGTAPAGQIGRLDGRVGVGAGVEGWKVQLAWDGARANSRSPRSAYPASARSGFVLSVQRPF